MALYFVSYDLRASRNYQRLYDELGSFNAVHVLESVWCFNRINTTAEGLVNYFKQFVDADDGLVILQANDWATYRALGTPNDL